MEEQKKYQRLQQQRQQHSQTLVSEMKCSLKEYNIFITHNLEKNGADTG